MATRWGLNVYIMKHDFDNLEPEQKTAKLEQIAAESLTKPGDYSNPFPEWLQKLLAEASGAKVFFDSDSAELKCALPGYDEAKEARVKFIMQLNVIASGSDERSAWLHANDLQISAGSLTNEALEADGDMREGVDLLG